MFEMFESDLIIRAKHSTSELCKCILCEQLEVLADKVIGGIYQHGRADII